MKIRKTGWIVWNKQDQKVKERNGMIVYSCQTAAWLAALKERKGGIYKIIKVKIIKHETNS